MNRYALIVAGGTGQRMNTGMPKQFLMLCNQPVLRYTIMAFQEAFADIRIIMVLPQSYLPEGQAIADTALFPDYITLVPGGASRFQSVKNGLEYIPSGSMVFIHDGVRCLVTPSLIWRCSLATEKNGNAIPATTAVDTIRLVTTNGNHPVDRSTVRIIQTPQTFYSDVVKAAYQQPYDNIFTDDASVVEKYGEKIHLVEGDHNNIKITTPTDLLLAEKILEYREKVK